jgi:hypothetical protein
LKELNVVKFIKQNPDWENILKEEPYSIIIKRKDNLVMFNYTQGVSQPCEIVNECRGLILDEANDYRVIRYGFYRFYNYGEPGAAEIDVSSMEVTEKIDGSLVMIYYYNNEWHYSTRNTFDACDAEIGVTHITFDTIIKKAIEAQNIPIDKFNRNLTYVFEVVSPESRVIIPYEETKLYFLMARDNDTLEEVTQDVQNYVAFFNGDCMLCPTEWVFNSIKEVTEFVSQFDGIAFEGVVVKDKYNNRLKVKNLNWLKLHALHQNGQLTQKRVLEMYMDGDLDEYLSYFPYEKEFAEKCLNEYKHIKMLMTDYDKTDYKSQFPERKDFAMFVKSQTESGIVNVPLITFKTLLFNAYDNKCVSWFNNLSAASYIRLFIGE